MHMPGNKKPITTGRGDGFWKTKKNRQLNGQPPPYERRHHQVLRRMCAVDMGSSIAVFCSQRQWRPRQKRRGGYFFAPLSSVFLCLRVNSTKRGVKPTSS
jgi:hypothetical protein